MAKAKAPLNLADEKVVNLLDSLSDDMLKSFSFPIFTQGRATERVVDADGFPEVSSEHLHNLHELQKLCWDKAESNPQINSHVRDFMGRMAGWGFGFSSDYLKIQTAVDEIMEDPRNDLYQTFPKFVARSEIEGELFLMYTLHTDGFVEVDFIAPRTIRGGGDNGSGIIFHPTKQTFPLFYLAQFKNRTKEGTESNTVLIPSINIAYYPELEKDVEDHPSYEVDKIRKSKSDDPVYAQFNGYYRFIVHWNRGFLTQRNISHIRTTIEWVNYYEALKKYEIDHKKSSGAYLWVIKIDDTQAFRRWLSMSEEDRKKTGVMQTKDPGGTLVLPPGMSVSVENPKLPNISDQDTDIMQMVSSGLQKPQDVMLGDYRSTYASVKASQGPQGDRINDELHYFKLFLQYTFWRPIFFLRSVAKPEFKLYRYIRETIRFENGEPVYGRVKKEVYKLVDICLPVSRLEDIESIAKAFLGSKHASVIDVLGIPRREIARRLGFPNYGKLRKEKSMEDEEFPETLSVADQESVQEKREAEPPKPVKEKENGTKKKPARSA
jgi:hypothetical protein